MSDYLVFNKKVKEALTGCNSSVTKIPVFSGLYDFTAFFHGQCNFQQQEAILNAFNFDIELIVVDCNDVTYFMTELPETLKNFFLKSCKNVITKSEPNIAQLIELFHKLSST